MTAPKDARTGAPLPPLSVAYAPHGDAHCWGAYAPADVRLGLTTCSRCGVRASGRNLRERCPGPQDRTTYEPCPECGQETVHRRGTCRACFFREMDTDARIDARPRR